MTTNTDDNSLTQFEDSRSEPKMSTVELGSPGPKQKLSKRRESKMFAIQQDAITQNNALGGKKFFPPKKDLEDDDYVEPQDLAAKLSLADEDDTMEGQTITLNGIEVVLAKDPQATGSMFAAPKRWIRTERSALAKDIRDVFWKSATSVTVLAKTNKLEAMSFKHDDEKLLFHVKNLHTQVKTIESHFYAHDCGEVFTIVIPFDVEHSPRIKSQTFDLFRDYATLHPAVVANSNAWYNNWVTDSTIRENLTLTFECLTNNTEPTLWSKAFEDHEEYKPFQQGGPLIFLCILKRIMAMSEASISYLQLRVKELKLSDLPGENVDDAVSLIKSTHKILSQVSTDTRNYVPDDFNETLLKVFQTSTCDAFNKTFSNEESDARRKADKYSGTPEYPSVSTLCTLATNTYKRFTSPGEDYKWCQPVSPGAAFTAVTGSYTPGNCFNCNKHGCRPGICTLDLDDARIAANKKAYEAWKSKQPPKTRSRSGDKSKSKSSSNSKSKQPSRKKDEQGRPLKKNKNGVYVLDQRKHRAQQADAQLQALAAAAGNADSPCDPTTFVADVNAVRKALAHI